MEPAVEREFDLVHRRLAAVEQAPINLAAQGVELSGFKEDIARVESGIQELHQRISSLRRDLDAREEREFERREDDRAERKKDRQWAFMAVIAFAGIVATALGLALG